MKLNTNGDVDLADGLYVESKIRIVLQFKSYA